VPVATRETQYEDCLLEKGRSCMGKRKRNLHALETKHKSAALTNTEVNRKRINLRGSETCNDSGSVATVETISNWLVQLRKRNFVASRSAFKGLLKELKNIAVSTLEQNSSAIVNAAIPFIIDQDDETRILAVKLLGGILERSSKPEFLPRSFISHLKIHLYHNGFSAFDTGLQLISSLKKYRKAYLAETAVEIFGLLTNLLHDNTSQRLPFSVESSEQQFSLAVQLMESFEALLSTICDSSPRNLEFEDLLKNNNQTKEIPVIMNETDNVYYGKDYTDCIISNKDNFLSELLKLVRFIFRTIKSFGKYPVIAVGEGPTQKKLLIVFSRVLSLTSNFLCRCEFSPNTLVQCEDHLPILVDTLRSFRLRDKILDISWQECLLRFAEFACFLCRFLDGFLAQYSDCTTIIINECVDICNDYLKVSSQQEETRSLQGFLVILAGILYHLVELLPYKDTVPLVDVFLAHWILDDIQSQCEFSCLCLLWQVVKNQDLLCRCEWIEKVFRSFLKVSWNSVKSRHMEKCKTMMYFWLAAVLYIPEQHRWVYEESCHLVKNFFGKRKKEDGRYSFVPGPFVFLDVELKRIFLSLLSHTSRLYLETVEALLLCVEHPNCIADQSSWLTFGCLLELLRRFSVYLPLEERCYIACLVVTVVCRLAATHPSLETTVTSLGKKCLTECNLDSSSIQYVIQTLQSEKTLPENLLEKVCC